MRRAIAFASWFLVGLLPVLVCWLLWLLVSLSPTQLTGGIASVGVHEPGPEFVRIPGRELVCLREARSDQCTVMLRWRQLDVSVIYEDGVRRQFAPNVRCEAFYDRRPVGCKAGYDYATGALPNVEIRDGLGWTPEDIQALQQQYWFAQFNDDNWMRLITGVAIASGLVMAFAVWVNLGQQLQTLVAISAGAGMFGLCYAAFTILLPQLIGLWGAWGLMSQAVPTMALLGVVASLSAGTITAGTLIRHRGQPSRWVLCLSSAVGSSLVTVGLASYLLFRWGGGMNLAWVIGVAIAIGILVAILTWFWVPQPARIVASLNVGAAVFGALWYSFFLSLIGLGLVD